MADNKDNVLDKAESLARRILERLGSKVDSKLASGSEQTLKPQVVADLASRIERVVESNLEEDEQGIRRIAPNRFKVLFTYEETSALSPQYIEAVGQELTNTVFEYVNNRRYATRGAIVVEASRDLFVKMTTVKAIASGERDKTAGAGQATLSAGAEESKNVSLDSTDGRRYRIELKPEGAPAYIGRVAGSGVRLDDPSVSRLHCSLSLRGGGKVVIADVGSANGTYVNEHLLGAEEARSLNTGDVIGVGDFKLTVLDIG